MFGELFNISIDPGPFDMDWSNIPIIKNHKLQKTKNGFFWTKPGDVSRNKVNQ